MIVFRYFWAFLLRPALTSLIALRALRRNKMRSILTALGIIIGVASVVAMVAVGMGHKPGLSPKSLPWVRTCSACSPAAAAPVV